MTTGEAGAVLARDAGQGTDELERPRKCNGIKD
jgi:hypothetical protein